MNWRIIITGDGRSYLVHVAGKTEEEAVAAAKRKIRDDLRGSELRVKSAKEIAI
jgi:hypothetical protein